MRRRDLELALRRAERRVYASGAADGLAGREPCAWRGPSDETYRRGREAGRALSARAEGIFAREED